MIVLRHSSFWIFFALSVLIGAQAVAFTIHILSMADVPMLFRNSPPPVHILLRILPLFWVCSFLLFIAAASWSLRHTPKGYKWTLPKILVVDILASVVTGVFFFNTGIAAMLDRTIITSLRPGLSAERYQKRLWHNPENGFLRGNIVRRLDREHFLLRDPRGREWEVELGSGALRNETPFSSGAWVHMRGKMLEEGIFDAESMMPDLRPPPPPRAPRMMR